MNDQLSARDLERISAYLDNQLSPTEKATFGIRVKEDPALLNALKKMQATRALLRHSPQRRIPRSFTVRHGMVSSSRSLGFANWSALNFVSAVASFLLILVFAGDIWAHGFPLAGLAAPAAEAPQAFMAQEATSADSAATATPTVAPAEGADEIERFAVPNQTEGLKNEPQLELRSFLIENARVMELGFAILAISTGFVAWRRRRQP